MRWVIAPEVPPAKRVALLDALATDAMRMPAVQQLAGLVPRAAGDRARAETLLALVHKLTYRADPPGEEVFQTADETIARGGDCEDLATLFVALARLAGLRARVVWLNQQIHGSALNHVFAQVFVDGRWLDAESSIAGAQLGEAPGAAARRLR
ncbi:MAG: transglutaminase domain-containing protein [Polyangiales bacterium]